MGKYKTFKERLARCPNLQECQNMGMIELMADVTRERGNALAIIAGFDDSALSRSLAAWVLEGGTVKDWQRRRDPDERGPQPAEAGDGEE